MSTYKYYLIPEPSRDEILRYLRSGKTNETDARIEKCITATEKVITPMVCFDEYPISVSGNSVDLGFARVESEKLSARLRGCSSAVVFVATVGIGIDRLMKRAEIVSPTDALIINAIGSERAEALADAFCKELRLNFEKKGVTLKPRFSPGYGDLDLSLNKKIFDSLGVSSKIGVTLTENMLMSPIKSVSAIVGVMNGAENECDR